MEVGERGGGGCRGNSRFFPNIPMEAGERKGGGAAVATAGFSLIYPWRQGRGEAGGRAAVATAGFSLIYPWRQGRGKGGRAAVATA
eukprot:178759-Chlamydomonas_euryale.AAC.1